jgi:hypothetical protein
MTSGSFLRLYYAMIAWTIDPSSANSNPKSGFGFESGVRDENSPSQLSDSVGPDFPANLLGIFGGIEPTLEPIPPRPTPKC